MSAVLGYIFQKMDLLLANFVNAKKRKVKHYIYKLLVKTTLRPSRAMIKTNPSTMQISVSKSKASPSQYKKITSQRAGLSHKAVT